MFGMRLPKRATPGWSPAVRKSCPASCGFAGPPWLCQNCSSPAPMESHRMEEVPALADLPVIFIPACGRDDPIVRAPDADGVDYIVKPCSPAEPTMHVQAALRRAPSRTRSCRWTDPIRYDQRLVAVAGWPMRLTPTEHELHSVPAVNAGRVLTHPSRCCARHGADGLKALPPTPSSRGPSSGGYATSWVTTRPILCTSLSKGPSFSAHPTRRAAAACEAGPAVAGSGDAGSRRPRGGRDGRPGS